MALEGSLQGNWEEESWGFVRWSIRRVSVSKERSSVKRWRRQLILAHILSTTEALRDFKMISQVLMSLVEEVLGELYTGSNNFQGLGVVGVLDGRCRTILSRHSSCS